MAIQKAYAKVLKAFLEKMQERFSDHETELNEIDTIKTELEDDFSNKSAKWQESNKGEAAQAIIDKLGEIYSEYESMFSGFESIVSTIEELTGEDQ